MMKSVRVTGVKRPLLTIWVCLALLSIGHRSYAAEPGDLECLIEPHMLIEVSSAVEGVVDSIEVEKSDWVTKGQMLARLEASVEKAAVAQAQARARMEGELLAKQTRLDFAVRKQNRIEDLFSNKAVSPHERDEATTDVMLARMELRQAEENRGLAKLDLKRAQVNLERRTIRSPISGVVVERFSSPGEFVKETPLLKLALMDPLRVEVIVPASRFGTIEPGMQAKIYPQYPEGQSYLAEVSIVDGIIDAASGTFAVRLELPNPDNRIPGGMDCRLHFFFAKREAASNEDPPALAGTPLASGQHYATSGFSSGDDDTASNWQRRRDEPALEAGLNPQLASRRIPEPRSMDTGPATDLDPGQTPPNTDAALAAATPVQNDVDRIGGGMELEYPGNPVLQNAILKHRVCRSVGPLRNLAQAERLETALAAGPLSLSVNRRESIGSVSDRYLLLTARGTKGKKRWRQLERLRKAGTKRATLLRRGQYEGRISLGTYFNAGDAEKSAKQYVAEGVKVEVVREVRRKRSLWLDLGMPPAETDDAMISGLIDNVAPGLRLKPAHCPRTMGG